MDYMFGLWLLLLLSVSLALPLALSSMPLGATPPPDPFPPSAPPDPLPPSPFGDWTTLVDQAYEVINIEKDRKTVDSLSQDVVKICQRCGYRNTGV